jgi:hypothetical protein
MQAIEFKTILHNGTVTIPPEYSAQWEGKTIRVIVLDDAAPIPATEANPLTGSITDEGDRRTDRAKLLTVSSQANQDNRPSRLFRGVSFIVMQNRKIAVALACDRHASGVTHD